MKDALSSSVRGFTLGGQTFSTETTTDLRCLVRFSPNGVQCVPPEIEKGEYVMPSAFIYAFIYEPFVPASPHGAASFGKKVVGQFIDGVMKNACLADGCVIDFHRCASPSR